MTASAAKRYETRPEDRISFSHKVIYGLGGFANNLLGSASGGMMKFLILGLGMRVEIVGLLGLLPRLMDAFTDPLMGYVSDHTRSKWGRRRPYIFIGAIATGLAFALLWQLPAGKSESYYFWLFLAMSLLFFLCYTVFATPWVALGYELTPDYHERTRLMGVQFFISQVAFLVPPWFLKVVENERYFDDMMSGAAWLAIAIGGAAIAFGILPAIFLKEPRSLEKADADASEASVEAKQESDSDRDDLRTVLKENMKGFFQGFATTLRVRPFLKLCVASFLVFNGFMLISSFQEFVVIYYLYDGDKAAAGDLIGWSGTVGALANFPVIAFVTWLATKIGKRHAFFVSTGVSIVGYSLKWFCYDRDNPWLMMLPPPIMAFGLGGLFTLMGSMIADVVDLDELSTHERREGMFGSIFWWVIKLGIAGAAGLAGVLLGVTGFEEKLTIQAEETLLWMRILDVGVPIICSAIAIWIIASYELTEEKAHEVRAALEQRRGSIPPA